MEGVPVMRMRGPVAAALCFALSACGSPFVEGSLSTLIDLHYRNVFVEASSTEVAVRFSMPHGQGDDTVLRVSAKLDGATLFANNEFDLAETISDGSQRGTVSRQVVNDPHQTFPAILIGKLVLVDLPGDVGSKVRGNFDVRFVDCIQFACGYTAFATFQGEVP
jgi:hypothetical protein